MKMCSDVTQVYGDLCALACLWFFLAFYVDRSVGKRIGMDVAEGFPKSSAATLSRRHGLAALFILPFSPTYRCTVAPAEQRRFVGDVIFIC